MSAFFAILSLLITLGMIFTVIFHASREKRYYLQLSSEELKAVVAQIPDGAVINITIGGITE